MSESQTSDHYLIVNELPLPYKISQAKPGQYPIQEVSYLYE